MRYSWCKSSEAVFQRQFEKAMNREYDAPMKKRKRFRSAFTTEQVTYLEKEFRKYPYIGNARRKDVALVLNIPERAVKIWFQNRRMKEKKDTVIKETDDKTIEASYDQLNNVQSTNDSSLPILTTTEERTPYFNVEGTKFVDSNKKMEAERKNTNNYKETSPEAESSSIPKIKINPSVIKSNPTSTFTSGEFSIKLFKKYKAVKSEGTDSDNTLGNISNNYKMREPHKEHQQNFNYAPIRPASMLPQDLSSKSNMNHQQLKADNQNHQNPNMKFASPEIPVYLKGFYAQPYYTPPGNMIWKPINVAQMMPSPVPSVTIANTGAASHQNMNRSCHCNCHLKPSSPPMYLHQNNHNPNLQYVITAVPFQNPKF